MISRVLRFSVRRTFARVLVVSALVTFNAPPAAALGARASRPPRRTQSLDSKLQARQERQKAIAREVIAALPQTGLTRAEMAATVGRGPNRNRGFSGMLPWQRSFRDVNLCNGNLFKSFTDIQVSPARGAGLAWQRTYNSNDDREGAFGIGWTHAYDIRTEEAGNNLVVRTDFFGGKHSYHRDADGLYSPPAYMFDELSSEYDNFLVEGPPTVLADDQKGMDGTVKHFISNGNERACDSITDRHGNATTLTYGLNVTIGGVLKGLLTRVTDPSGRYLDISWANLGTTQDPHYRITQVAGPIDPGTQ